MFHERLTAKQIICFVMSTLGLVLIIGTGGGEETAGITGILFGLGAAVFYAAVILLNKFIKNVAGIQRTILQMLAFADAGCRCYFAAVRGVKQRV